MAATVVTTFPSVEAPGGRWLVAGPDQRLVRFSCALSVTYATGGFAFDPAAANAGLVPSNTKITRIQFDPAVNTTPGSGGHTCLWDSANNKVLLMASGATEMANGASLTGFTVTGTLYLTV